MNHQVEGYTPPALTEQDMIAFEDATSGPRVESSYPLGDSTMVTLEAWPTHLFLSFARMHHMHEGAYRTEGAEPVAMVRMGARVARQFLEFAGNILVAPMGATWRAGDDAVLERKIVRSDASHGVDTVCLHVRGFQLETASGTFAPFVNWARSFAWKILDPEEERVYAAYRRQLRQFEDASKMHRELSEACMRMRKNAGGPDGV